MQLLDKHELEYRRQARGRYPQEVRWYAVMVQCGREGLVQRWVEEDLYDLEIDEVLLPFVRPIGQVRRHQKALGKELLFSSYLFLRCRMTDGIYMPMCDHGSVYQILGRAYRIPHALEDEEIERFRQILESDCRPEVVTRQNVGDVAEVVSGLAEGVRGRVIAVNATEVKIQVPFSFFEAGTCVALTVPLKDVRLSDAGSQTEEQGAQDHVDQAIGNQRTRAAAALALGAV